MPTGKDNGVLVPAHPTKNAPPDNLLLRGGGAFLNEMDGNLTCKKREQIVEVHWLGKFRGPEFAPIAFKLTPWTSDKLKDSKGRHIWTVTAKPLGHDCCDLGAGGIAEFLDCVLTKRRGVKSNSRKHQ